jgi:CheY-like chemotaxis protein
MTGRGQNRMSGILFIDDEHHATRLYARELEKRGHEVVICNNPDDAIVAATSRCDFDLVITDLMMQPGLIMAEEETAHGFLTGARLAVRLTALMPKIPVVIFTALSSGDLLQELAGELQKFKNIVVLQKRELDFRELSEAIDRLLSGKALRSPVVRKFYDSLLLQPNVGGLGIDLKKFIAIFKR